MTAEKQIACEKLSLLIATGFLAFGLANCEAQAAPNINAEYEPFTDQIIYYHGTENDAGTVAHEEGHKARAHAYPGGRIVWGLRYELDRRFSCDEELAVGADMSHPSCKGLQK